MNRFDFMGALLLGGAESHRLVVVFDPPIFTLLRITKRFHYDIFCICARFVTTVRRDASTPVDSSLLEEIHVVEFWVGRLEPSNLCTQKQNVN